MSLTLSKIHEYKTEEGTGQSRIVKERQTIRLKSGEHPPIWIQDGKLYYEGGDPVKDIPEWFWKEYDKIEPKLKIDHKLEKPDGNSERDGSVDRPSGPQGDMGKPRVGRPRKHPIGAESA